MSLISQNAIRKEPVKKKKKKKKRVITVVEEEREEVEDGDEIDVDAKRNQKRKKGRKEKTFVTNKHFRDLKFCLQFFSYGLLDGKKNFGFSCVGDTIGNLDLYREEFHRTTTSSSAAEATMVKYSREPDNQIKSCKTKGSDLRVHFKNNRETTHAIRKLPLVKAKRYLEDVLTHKHS